MEKEIDAAVALFVEKFKPSEGLVKPDEETLKKISESVLPEEYVTLVKEYGFGNYGNGIIKVINPFAYADSLYTWLGKKDENKLPIMMTAFGDLFYFRKIDETESDICSLDVHYKDIKVCSIDFEEFVEDYLLDEEIEDLVLRKQLFSEAFERDGELKLNEIFLFVPALAIGGGENIKYIKKGDAITQQHLLLQL
ncbi:hypothetical protein PIROE2DRAFT_62905 [Piromyces sp. E2]|nr:hypothetical protein PIROE2DRAFT_62905 [Piromyces sp. E2]|eukprot:OUM60821.1 hypothetical protein PIROE2DRAFT_62905 [Piromyces sp. E2]